MSVSVPETIGACLRIIGAVHSVRGCRVGTNIQTWSDSCVIFKSKMQDQWSDEAEKSRPTSRRNSGPFSRRGSVKKEPEKKIVTAPASSSSTPKKVSKPQNLDFVVTGKQLLKRGDRAHSLPAAYHRRQSVDSLLKSKRTLDSPRRVNSSSKSRNTSLECDMSLDLSQVSDFEDTSSKYGIKSMTQPVATSTPKKCLKSRSYSLQKESRLESKKSRESVSEESFHKTPSSAYSNSNRQALTELDYSSMSPECSGPSSGDSALMQDTLVSPRSQDYQDTSFCVSTYQEEAREAGEWGHFWANYNNSLARVPISRYYDQCPTPYRSDVDLADFELSTDGSRKRSPDNIKTINNIIRNEGIRLTPRETQNIIKCAHILGNVLTKAIERQTKEINEKIQDLNPIPPPEKELKKKTMTLDLKETVMPLEVKTTESVPTQTDISLPNTKSAPKIFENILRQLSLSSLDVKDKDKEDNLEE
ncbi:unnamed protein product, partial [Brenthis ino]